MDTRESAILNLALNYKEEWVGEMDIVVGTRQGVTLLCQFMMMSPADLTASSCCYHLQRETGHWEDIP